MARHQQREVSMKRMIVLVLAAGIASALLVHAQGETPFKLGTFQRAGRTFVGIVLRASVVVDLAAANRAIRAPATNVVPPGDMKDLIARYDSGVRARILDIVRAVNAQSAARPAYVYELTALKTMPPIMYPT